MIFTTLKFIFIFLPIVFIGYCLLPIKARNIWLLLASMFFYYVGAKEQILLLLSIITISYISGMALDHSRNNKNKKLVLIVSITAILSFMLYFKYFNFFIDNLNSLLHSTIEHRDILLPLGISFYTFQSISYIADVYKGYDVLRNPIDVALYISFFPKLIAGPIVSYSDIKNDLNCKHRALINDDIVNGIWKFCKGFSKKVLIANNISTLTSIVFGIHNINEYSILYSWLGAIAYTLEIYYDFSGYSDMAIGLGKIFGFNFAENFNFPYIATSLKDFWRRWHISLSLFFRNYVYFPLGGNRCSKLKWARNMIIVWALTGFWHGASWNYIVWGLLYGILLLIERTLKLDKISNKVCKLVYKYVTIIIIIIMWVIFKCEDLNLAGCFLANMFGFANKNLYDKSFIFQFKNYWFLILTACVLAVPENKYIFLKTFNPSVINTAKTLIMILAFISSISYIYMGSYNPFLYIMF